MRTIVAILILFRLGINHGHVRGFCDIYLPNIKSELKQNFYIQEMEI